VRVGGERLETFEKVQRIGPEGRKGRRPVEKCLGWTLAGRRLRLGQEGRERRAGMQL
jgi:hypothetical protein